MLRSPVYPSLALCGLGYMFLALGDSRGAIFASMASITTVWFGQFTAQG